MAIYDCFTYCGEDLILDLRLNILNNFVDKFVIVEADKFHNGENKELQFDLNKYNKFKDKIIYIPIKDFPVHNGDNWIYERFQRNGISRGLNNCKQQDLILVSDVDEIPNPNVLKKISTDRGVFLQNFYYYKFNFKCTKGLKWFNKWPGTKYTLYKHFKTAQGVRELRVKNYSWWRFDKPIKQKIIINGGWHFSFIMNPENISKKIKSYSHKEYQTSNFMDVKKIERKIKEGKDLFDRKDLVWNYVKIDEDYPSFFLNNIEKYKKWIN